MECDVTGGTAMLGFPIDNNNKRLSNTSKANTSLEILVGSNSALTIAFKDLKRRYIKNQIDLNQSKYENLSVTTELEQIKNEIVLKDRNNLQLRNSLDTKLLACDHLEKVYKQTCVNESFLSKHLKENEKILDDLMKKYDGIVKENQRITYKLERASKKIAILIKEKTQLEEELLEFKNIPEICIHQNINQVDNNPKIDNYNGDKLEETVANLKRQIVSLLSEKQTLKTNVHWLTMELQSVKGKTVTQVKRKRNLSETLEEACVGSLDKDSSFDEGILQNPANISQCNNKLHCLFSELHASLSNNNVLIERLIKPSERIKSHNELCYSKSDPLTATTIKKSNSTTPNVISNNDLLDKCSDDKFKNTIMPCREVCRINVDGESVQYLPTMPSEQRTNIDFSGIETVNSPGIETDLLTSEFSYLQNGMDELPKLGEPLWGSDNDTDLPYPLFQEIHLLQTQTYLTSKTTVPSTKTIPSTPLIPNASTTTTLCTATIPNRTIIPYTTTIPSKAIVPSSVHVVYDEKVAILNTDEESSSNECVR